MLLVLQSSCFGELFNKNQHIHTVLLFLFYTQNEILIFVQNINLDFALSKMICMPHIYKNSYDDMYNFSFSTLSNT